MRARGEGGKFSTSINLRKVRIACRENGKAMPDHRRSLNPDTLCEYHIALPAVQRKTTTMNQEQRAIVLGKTWRANVTGRTTPTSALRRSSKYEAPRAKISPSRPTGVRASMHSSPRANRASKPQPTSKASRQAVYGKPRFAASAANQQNGPRAEPTSGRSYASEQY